MKKFKEFNQHADDVPCRYFFEKLLVNVSNTYLVGNTCPCRCIIDHNPMH